MHSVLPEPVQVLTSIPLHGGIWVTKESRGNVSELTKKLASTGAYGRHPQNIERDVFRALQLPLDPWNNFSCFVFELSWGPKTLTINT